MQIACFYLMWLLFETGWLVIDDSSYIRTAIMVMGAMTFAAQGCALPKFLLFDVDQCSWSSNMFTLHKSWMVAFQCGKIFGFIATEMK